MLVTLIAAACVWTALMFAVRRAVDTSNTARKLELLAEEVRTLRRELRKRNYSPRESEASGHRIDHSV